jgi:hypothetical protein
MKSYLNPKKSNDYTYIPVASIQDTPRGLENWKSYYAGSPAAKNVLFVNKENFQVHVQKNTLFAGWTIPITLGTSKHVLSPSCILFEGYSKVKPGRFSCTSPSGLKVDAYYNCVEALVSFFHHASKYSGPGTEGFIDREVIITY